MARIADAAVVNLRAGAAQELGMHDDGHFELLGQVRALVQQVEQFRVRDVRPRDGREIGEMQWTRRPAAVGGQEEEMLLDVTGADVAVPNRCGAAGGRVDSVGDTHKATILELEYYFKSSIWEDRWAAER